MTFQSSTDYTPSIGTTSAHAFSPSSVVRRRTNISSPTQNLPSPDRESTVSAPKTHLPPLLKAVEEDDVLVPALNRYFIIYRAKILVLHLSSRIQVADNITNDAHSESERNLEENYLNLDLAFPLDLAESYRADEVADVDQISRSLPNPPTTIVAVKGPTRPKNIHRRIADSPVVLKLSRIALPEVPNAEPPQRSPQLIDFSDTSDEGQETPLADLGGGKAPESEESQYMIDPENDLDSNVERNDINFIPGDGHRPGSQGTPISTIFTSDIRSPASTPSNKDVELEEKAAIPDEVPSSPGSSGSDSGSLRKSALKVPVHAEQVRNKQVHFPRGLAQGSTNSSPSLSGVFSNRGEDDNASIGGRSSSVASRSRRSSRQYNPYSAFNPYNAYPPPLNAANPQTFIPPPSMPPTFIPPPPTVPSTPMSYPGRPLSTSYSIPYNPVPPTSEPYPPLQTPLSYPPPMPTYTNGFTG